MRSVGLAVRADAIQNGLCPEHRQLDPKRNVENAQRGMELAFKNFSVPMILDPADMCNPRVPMLPFYVPIGLL